MTRLLSLLLLLHFRVLPPDGYGSASAKTNTSLLRDVAPLDKTEQSFPDEILFRILDGKAKNSQLQQKPNINVVRLQATNSTVSANTSTDTRVARQVNLTNSVPDSRKVENDLSPVETDVILSPRFNQVSPRNGKSYEMPADMGFAEAVEFWETVACNKTHQCNRNSFTGSVGSTRKHCKFCHCDYCSAYDNCCVDKAMKKNIIPIPMSCLSGTEGWLNNFRVQTFHFVNQCPKNYRDVQVRNTCESSNQTFTLASKNPPVYGRKTRLNYINSHCAQCQGESDNLEQWTPTANCDKTVDFSSIRSRQDILGLVEQSVCYVSFSPAPASVPRKCSRDIPPISDCNMTGQWREFDPDLRRACLKYDNVIWLCSQRYRNVFCAMCNGYVLQPFGLEQKCENDNLDIPEPFRISVDPFSKIFDLTPEDPEVNDMCPAHSVFDRHKGICRELVCSTGRIVSDYSCVPAFLTAKGVGYRLHFDLVPEEFPEKINTTIRKVWTDFVDEMKLYETHLGSLYQKFVMYACYHSIPNCDINFETLPPLQMLSLEFEYNMIIGKDIDQELAESYLLDTAGSRKFIHRDPGKPLLYIVHNEQLITGDIICNRTELELKGESSDLNIPDSMIYLTRMSKCNQIELNDTEFSVDNYTGTITLKIPAKEVDASQYMVVENKTRICAHYIQTTWKDLTGSLITVICITASLVCLLLTILLCLWSKSRHTPPGLITLMLVITLFVAQALFLAHSYVSEWKWACQCFGMTLHYAWLVVFFWKNVAAFHMYAAFTHPFVCRTTSPKRLLLKYALYAFGVPAILVTCYVSIKSLLSNREGLGYKNCFLSTTLDLCLGFFAPVVLVLFANAYFFGRAVRVMRQMSEFEKHSNLSNSSHVALYIKMSLVLGVTWVIGVLANIFDVRVLWYVFDVMNGGSGLFIFLSHVSNTHILGRLRSCFNMKESSIFTTWFRSS